MSVFFPTVVLLLLVGFMYYGAAWARRHLGLGAGTVTPDALRVVGKRMLEPRKALYVVEVGDRYVLVGTAEGSVSLIDHITAEEFAAMSTPAPAPAATPATATPAGTDAPAPIAEQRFATVGESFHYFLDRARTSRHSRDDVAAQMAAARTDEDA